MSIKFYIHLPGVMGKAKEANHFGWIEGESYSWGSGVGIYRTDTQFEISNASISEFSFTTESCSSDAAILFHMLAKRSFEQVTIEFIKMETKEVAFSYTLTEVFISGFSQRIKKNGKWNHVSLNFVSVEMLYAELDTNVAMLRKERESNIHPLGREDMTGERGSFFGYLPEEQLLNIFSYLSPKDLQNVARTCRRFFKMASDRRILVIDEHSVAFAPGKNGKAVVNVTQVHK